jgi:hypothetical protein
MNEGCNAQRKQLSTQHVAFLRGWSVTCIPYCGDKLINWHWVASSYSAQQVFLVTGFENQSASSTKTATEPRISFHTGLYLSYPF